MSLSASVQPRCWALTRAEAAWFSGWGTRVASQRSPLAYSRQDIHPSCCTNCQHADTLTISGSLQSKTIGDNTVVRFNKHYCPELAAAMALGTHSMAGSLSDSSATWHGVLFKRLTLDHLTCLQQILLRTCSNCHCASCSTA